ncbi:N-acetylmannosamine-6-phosphate 2-epimerase [Actinocatenispora rupis]|uniref:N-acylglucosamine-6-phosphate 2-epimerase n=1 Tax=Actinocatenispora rupis TaxID=519421 RepID=A0A8J3JD94_9ACTN|nr:N-acetylmannosamine-6-phosphate 2-epimerase [Actinocatenispora rupis]GID13843.1 putative N-acetylmannosamine-6-phosphate 2-epimerase [Actinocatenispora rupis]
MIGALRGGLIVSCQARAGSPLRDVDTIVRLARAVVAGGAAAVRLNGPDDIAAVRAAVDVPVIGLWKDEALRGPDTVFVTPTVARALAVVDAGAHIVAADGTTRPRPDGRTFADLVAAVHERGVPVLADVATVADALAAQEAGADCVATTLSGYTTGTAGGDGPDLDLVTELVARLTVPVVAEGRLATPEQVAEAYARGCLAAVVGTAITNPAWLTARFAAVAPAAPTPSPDATAPHGPATAPYGTAERS